MRTNEPYNPGNLAYKRNARNAQPEPSYRPARNVEIIEGGGRKPKEDLSAGHTFAIKAAKLTVIAVLAFAGMGFARITLDAATINEALAARQYEKQLDVARSAISDLQAEQSSLSNPARIKNKATLLGMGSPRKIEVIDISGDIVGLDEKGNLSISESLKALAAKKAKGSKK